MVVTRGSRHHVLIAVAGRAGAAEASRQVVGVDAFD